jgi:hypothetical protein
MFCSKCGQAVEDGVNFCNKCGNNLSQKTEITGQVINEKKQEATQFVVVMPSGTAPLVMGLLGMFGGFIPIVKYFTGILSIVAIFVGASQRRKLKDANLPSGKATAGLVLGIIAVLITVISIVISGIFIGSLFSGLSSGSTYKPSRTVNNYSYVAPKVKTTDLDGKWTGGNNSHWLIIFNGEDVTVSENINYKYDNRTAMYARRNKGHFTKTKNYDLPAGYFNDGKDEKYTFIYTQAWRNGSWVDLDKPKEEVFYIGITDEDHFSLRKDVVTFLWEGIDYYYKKAPGEIINYE